MNPKNTITTVIVIALALSIGVWFSFSMEKDDVKAQNRQSALKGNILSPARRISVPMLEKHDGSPFTGADLKGHWSIIFYGFTHCSEICPAAMSVLAQAKKISEERKLEFPQVFLVSVDPERDDLKALTKFVTGFDESFTGVTGDPKLIKALSLQMNVFYEREKSTAENKDDYQIGHSAAMFLMDPDGNLLAYLSAPHTPEKLVESINEVIDSRS